MRTKNVPVNMCAAHFKRITLKYDKQINREVILMSRSAYAGDAENLTR